MRNEPNKTIETLLSRFGWEVDAAIDIPPREPKFAVIDSPDVHRFTKQFAQTLYPNGLYVHQKLAIEAYAQGNNVCVATSTASGKTAVFHLAMVETFSRESSTRILCMYPTKALASEQAQRWQVILHKINKNAKVGIISGDVPVKARTAILRQSHVVVVTPDIVHAWLLPQCGDSHVCSFLGKLRLIIIDEAHTYTGVFGSNTAFLFRRLRHICDYLKSPLRFIAASATIANPEEHLNKLTGLDFAIIEENVNGSQRYPTTIRLVTPPAHEDIMTGLPKLLTAIGKTSLKSITFVDSRKQVELITSIVTRDSADDGMAPDSQTEEDSFYDYSDSLQHLSRLSILPYRAGYEASDREAIQNRLQSGALNGVISTSALELGIDIPHLDIAILVGVPSSSTSLYQRIGRVGRQKSGEVLIINSGTPYDTAIFAHPENILNRPPAQSALYLENLRIQYIHALCLARLGGEHDQSRPDLGDDTQFATNVSWADGFLELCTQERSGQISSELQSMKGEAGDNPNHAFPLRDLESQFKIMLKHGPEQKNLGSLSHSQCMREAYPGAVYRYATIPYRVYSVNRVSREVKVRRERSYITKPIFLPTLVFPNFSDGNIYNVATCGNVVIAECNVQIREWISGFIERRGSQAVQRSYPLVSIGDSLNYAQPTFFRNYFTSGLIFLHPSLGREGVDIGVIQSAFYEAFLFVVPFERADISSAYDKLRTSWNGFSEGTRFISIYDSTYGSLRLSGQLLQAEVIQSALSRLLDFVSPQEITPQTLTVLQEIASLFTQEVTVGAWKQTSDQTLDEDVVEIIMPESYGLHGLYGNSEFQVQKIYWNAKEGRLYYKGVLDFERNRDMVHNTPISNIRPIPGESKLGKYWLETGEITT